jgi:transposase-like protein
MAAEIRPASEPARKREPGRGAVRKRRTKRTERREAYFDLLTSGYTYHQIARAMKVTPLSVRRAVDRAIAERRQDSPDRYIHLQVARLTKALRAADMGIEKGDLRAVAPFVRVVEALDRYHGFGVKYQRRLDARALAEPSPAPPIALTHATREPGEAEAANVSESGD